MCCLLTVQGIAFADLTPAALLHHAHTSREAKAVLRPGKKDAKVFAGRAAWNVLHAMGHFPASTPATMRQALHRGQLTLKELVDRHPIRNQRVRQLLLDYFHRRKADTDYASLVNLVRHVTHHFWTGIEAINPEQADLNIPADLYSTWRRQISIRHDGKPRIGVDTIVIAVRSFYYDLHTWAADEPERWADWVAPCPVPPSELRGLAKRRRRINERSADRTRLRQPLLPLLVQHVEERYDRARVLLEHATAAVIDTSFTYDGRTYRRVLTAEDRTRARGGHRTPVRVRDNTGQLIHIEAEERKVELGACGRPYGTPCQHEHACIRCPMLQISPKMISRLDDLEGDLIARRTRAHAEGWAGEIEGLNLTLALLRTKRDESQRMARRPAVDLGIPARRRPKKAE
ncbi:hypothetical protein [Streptomyces tendae]|uniref:hypothetical protein n=1 Tax=Streptomyces tendae TaxID=1932 RepID=UPI003664AAC3